MIDFPIDELLDEQACLVWLERYLHPDGLQCARCGSADRRVARRLGVLTAYRCADCDFYTDEWRGYTAVEAKLNGQTWASGRR